MAPTTERTDTAPATADHAVVPSTHQRRDMAVIWWSTYASILFLVAFVYTITYFAGSERQGGTVSIPLFVLGAIGLVAWAVGVLPARHGITTRTFTTRWFALAGALGAVMIVASYTADNAGGTAAAALPLACVLSTAGFSLRKKGRAWLILLALVLPAAHLYIWTALHEVSVDQTDYITTAWLSVFTILGIPSSLWVWAVMVELDVTRQRAAELAIANERLRFAADLHDVQGHHLQVISLKTDLAARLLAKDKPDAAASHILEAHQSAQTALQETRALVQGYRTTTLTQELNNASAVLESAGVNAQVNIPILIRQWSMSPEATTVSSIMGLVVREATTNILRHSQATNARFSLSFIKDPQAAEDALVQLQIRNDGTDTTTAASSPQKTRAGNSGTGLRGLAQRLSDIGGDLRTENDPAHEFTLTITVPKNGSHAQPRTEDREQPG